MFDGPVPMYFEEFAAFWQFATGDPHPFITFERVAAELGVRPAPSARAR